GGGRSPAGLWLGVAALAVAIAGAALACIDATALAGWIVAGVGLALGVALLLWPKTPKVLSGAATVLAAAGLNSGVILHFTVYDDDDGDSDSGQSSSPQSGSAPWSGPSIEPSGSARPDRPSSAPSSSPSAPSSTPRRGRSSSSADGSRSAPFSFGTAERMGDWEVAVFEPYDGWDEIRAESPHETPPDSDTEFWLFPIEATKHGSEAADVWMALTAGFEDDSGELHGGFCAGTIPEDLYYFDEVEPGETVTGNLCVEKPIGSSGLWTLDVDFREDFYFD